LALFVAILWDDLESVAQVLLCAPALTLGI
jgi:hypothetical protein